MHELTHPELRRAALEEYRLAHEASEIELLRTKHDFPNVPLCLSPVMQTQEPSIENELAKTARIVEIYQTAYSILLAKEVIIHE